VRPGLEIPDLLGRLRRTVECRLAETGCAAIMGACSAWQFPRIREPMGGALGNGALTLKPTSC